MTTLNSHISNTSQKLPGYANGAWFGDWRNHLGLNINKSLLWDCGNLESFDWNKHRILVVQRVIERGFPSDYYAAIELYGGLDNFKNILKQIPYLPPIYINFIETYFQIPKTELKCYLQEQSRAALLKSWENSAATPD